MINSFTKSYCIIGDNKVLILNNSKHKNIIEVGKLNNYGLFEIELIIDIKNNYDEEEKKILKFGFEKYFQTYFVFTNKKDKFDYISPLFNEENKIKGYGYKIIKNPFDNNSNDFSDYVYNDILIKVI